MVDLQLPVQSVPVTTKIVSLNPVHGEVYSIQHYVIKFVRDLRQVCGFLWVLPISSTNKTDCHDITEILLKVALNTINQLTIHNTTWAYSCMLFFFLLTVFILP